MSPLIKTLYKCFRKVAPVSINGFMSKMVFKFGNKPSVQKDKIHHSKKFPNSEKGGLIISADFEMAWAWRYTKTNSDAVLKGHLERENLPRILEILETYQTPITFATVGHLFLERCKPGDHEWMRRIPHFDDHWKFTKGDWYDHDPHSDYKSAPAWYAPDLIQMIIDSNIGHRIGTHTFSHIDFSYTNCPAGVAADELRACMDVAKPLGISLKSMVFPGGKWGHVEILKNYGIQIYRRNVNQDLAYPYRDKYGLLVTNSSGAFEYNPGYGWSAHYYIQRLKKYIDKAIQTNTIAHLWFHPSLDPYILENVFPPFLEYASRQREKGDLWVGTMEDIADHINEKEVL